MCFFNQATPTINTTVAPAPRRDPNSLIGRLFTRRARGVQDTIATSALGDSNFGKNVKKATVLGGATPTLATGMAY